MKVEHGVICNLKVMYGSKEVDPGRRIRFCRHMRDLECKELAKKVEAKRELIEKERDEVIIKAIRERNISRAEACVFADLIRNDKCFDEIMKLEPSLKKKVKKEESKEEVNDEE